MAKTKTKFKGVVKGAALGFALIMASAFFPAKAVASAVDYTDKASAKTNTSRIEVEGQNASFSVKRGEKVSVPSATYEYKKVDSTAGSHVIGTAPDADATAAKIESSAVRVYYKATGDEVDATGAIFTADKVGTYVIEYSVVVDGIPYSYEQLVSVEASEASFEFKANDKNIIPGVYDIALAEKKLEEGKRDVVLPLPTVNDDEGKPIISAKDSDYYTIDRLNYEIPTGTNAKNGFVSITLAGNLEGADGQPVKIRERDVAVEGGTVKEYFIAYEDLAVLNSHDIKIFYAFYQKSTSNKDVFVASTSKTFTVKSNHYFAESEKQTVGYDLVASFAGSKPDTAVVGVEKAIPTIKASTSSTNAPASETVDVYYELEVYKANDKGNYGNTENIASKVITEDGKFKATEEGSYKFVYKVSDFYGYKGVETNTTFEIKNVKDTIAANVYIYDASNPNAYNTKENTYESAESIVKKQSVNRNIIMYAIGGTDNMTKRYQDLTPEEKENGTKYISLRRVIRDNNQTPRFEVTDVMYNDYNLIFGAAKVAGSTTSIWQTIVSDNYQIYKQMVLAGKSVTNDDQIKEFLKENKYLVVSTELGKGIDGETISSPANATDEEIKQAMFDAGYAYVAPKTTGYTFEGKEGSFTLYYYAKDNVNNNKETSLYAPVKLANSISDAGVPTVNFTSNLQSAYLPSDTIEFDVATATDTTSNSTVVTAYRYLNAFKSAIGADEKAGTTSTLKYVVKNAKTDLMKPVDNGGEWYAQQGVVSSEGWFVDNDAMTYKVDLANKPSGASFIEILAYAVDDYGNVGFFNKVISIADMVDENAPTINKVVNAPSVSNEYISGSPIVLPTLYFKDAHVDYMNAEVKVYRVVKGATAADTRKIVVKNSGMKTNYDTYQKLFWVDAGMFSADIGGTYQVAVTVVDGGNHSVTTYFDYKVEQKESDVEFVIDNISDSKPIELEPGRKHYLVPPTITMLENSRYGYIGIDEQDDAYTSTYYDISVVDAPSSDYNLEKFYFTGNSRGTYQIEYTAFLIQYEKNALKLKSEATDGELFIENGDLMYRVETGVDEYTDYYVYIDRENGNALAANADLGEGEALASDKMEKLAEIVKVKVTPPATQTIKVSEVFIKVHIDEDAYAVEKFASVGNEVKIVKPEVEFKGSGASMNEKESTVSITKTMGGTTTTVATINFADWQKAVQTDDVNFRVSGSDIFLKLKDNGEYKVAYSIQAQAGGQNIGDPNKDHVYTFASGDTKKPEISANKKEIIKDKQGKSKSVFKIGEKLVIDMAALTVSDNVTTERDALLAEGKLVVTYRNTTLNEGAKTLENKATEAGKYVYEIEKLETAGDYVITFTVKDGAGNISAQEIVNFEVSTKTSEAKSAKETMGGVLIGVSVALLVGVVGYFVVSKIKLDRKEKGYKKAGKDKKKD